MKQIVTVGIFWIVAVIFVIQETGAVTRKPALKMRSRIYKDTKRLPYIKLPTNTYDPKIKNYVKVRPEKNFTYAIDFYCQRNDPRVCIMYDKLGYVAGIQLSFLVEDFNDVDPHDYNISAVKGYEKTNFFGMPAYSVRAYFTNPCLLDNSGRRDTNEVVEVLLIKIGEEWVKVDQCQPNGPKMGDFYLQSCFPGLGTIYAYKFNQFVKTCHDPFLFYVSYDRGSLVEFGLVNIGYGTPGPKTDWYAHPKGEPWAHLVPDHLPCIQNYMKYDLTSFQVYLIDNPDSIRCQECND